MKEIKEIIAAFEQAQREEVQTALATLVHVEGSSYRRPGARMLIREDGMMTGAISGGCLEGDVLRKALLAIAEKKPKLLTYDTSDEDNEEPGLGLGCNGVIRVLIEPIHPRVENNPLQLLKSAAIKGNRSVLVTAFSWHDKKEDLPGTCLLYSSGQVLSGTFPDASLQEIMVEDANRVYQKGINTTKTYMAGEKQITAFFECVQPPVSLVIAGAGNDASPLVNMATVMGWEVTVVDGRPDYANKNRFSSGCQVVVSRPESVLSSLSITEQSAFVLMTHNYNYDLALLRQLILYDIKYIGVLGPKKKLNKMLQQLHEEGMPITDEQLSKIYGPVGLDIGAETPEEIALSILAEIKAVMAKKKGVSLRDKEAAIHPRRLQHIEQVWLRQA